MGRRSTVVAAVLVVAATGCTGSSSVETSGGTGDDVTTTTGARHEVASTQVTIVDDTRETPAAAGLPAEPERVLVTDIHHPVDDGPHPLVAFAHGLNGHPRKFGELFEAWAAAGYVVAAPVFPRSNDELPEEGTAADLRSQPGDVSAVIDGVLRLSEGDGEIAGLVDPGRIGAAGLSLGGATTYGLVYGDCCLDDRVDAAMVMDGALIDPLDLTLGTPLLVYHATGDGSLPYEDAAAAFAEAVAPKWFVTLDQATHAEPFEDTPDRADDLVIESSVAFWDRYLRDEPAAEDVLRSVVEAAPFATLEAET